jgi:hypothetical protein
VTGQPTGKPTVAELGIDPAAQAWRRSGSGDGAIEIAFAHAADTADAANAANTTDAAHAANAAHATDTAHATKAAGAAEAAHATNATDANGADRAEWVLMRMAGDPEQRVLVFDRHEWECFLDGARKGEFDDAAAGQ